MSKFELISTNESSDAPDIQWKLCFLCQEVRKEELVNPVKRRGFDRQRNTLRTVSVNLKAFEEIDSDSLPRNIQKLCEKFENPDKLAEELISKEAVVHKSCTCLYNTQKVNRKRKSFEAAKDKNGQNEQESTFEDISEENSSNLSERIKRRRRSTKPDDEEKCYFCMRSDENEDLHLCQTFNLNDKVWMMAKDLSDHELLAKLSTGDMMSSDAKYHLKCLNDISNRYRKSQSKKKKIEEQNCIEGIALSEIIDYIKDRLIASTTSTPVFMMKDLRIKYQEILTKHGFPQDCVHVTRLKESILEEIPYLKEETSGKYTILTPHDIGSAIYNASKTSKSEGSIIFNAAKLIRKSLFTSEVTFDGDLSNDRQSESVPPQLVLLLALILEDSKETSISKASQDLALKISQLVKFNSVKTKRTGEHIRRSTTNEPPLPVMIGLSVHSQTREKRIVEELHDKGLSISYDRVLTIENNITKTLCKKYCEEKKVLPPSLQPDEFSVAAIDNMDNDPKSNTAKSSFHGTTISIFQFPEANTSTTQPPFKYTEDNNTADISLPESYTNILPTKDYKAEPLDRKTSTSPVSECSKKTKVQSWVDKMSAASMDTENLEDRVSFSAFFASRSESSMPKTRSCLLPLIDESINSTAMVRHCIEIVQSITYSLNPGQKVIITADQPVYALGKQVQWMYNDRYSDVIWMMGPLHIEMAYMGAIGDWIEGSGWVEALKKANVSTPGRIESFLSGSKVKRTRYAHQVSLAAWVRLAKNAFDQQTVTSDFESWKTSCLSENANARFWFGLIEMQVLLFDFVKSLRDADFTSFLNDLKRICQWMFSMDHTHYARWLPVFINDLEKLDTSTRSKFEKGYFTIKRSNRPFSNIGIDQAHEQNNKIVKIRGGAVGLLDNPKALLRWSVSNPIIAEMCGSDRIASDEDETDLKHHEDTPAFEKQFRKDVNSLVAAVEEMGNPFIEKETNLVQISSKTVLPVEATNQVKKAEKTGKDQFQTFIKDRLHSEKKSLYDVIPKNKLLIFKQSNMSMLTKSKERIQSLTADRRLFSRLFIACQSRKGDLQNFFSHENHGYPIAISEYGRLRKCTAKSDFVTCLKQDVGEPDTEAPQVDMKVIDGPALVNMNAPAKTSTTFNCYSNQLKKKIVEAGINTKRVDVVFDIYKQRSLKSQTRESRGQGIRTSVRHNTPVPKDFSSFMRDGKNKTELFELLADNFASIKRPIIVSTKGNGVTSNLLQAVDRISPSNHEEADTRIFTHIYDGRQRGYTKFLIVTVDTDVIVIALYHFFSIGAEELWVEFGVGIKKRYYAIHEYARALGEEVCRALPLWFTFTGCDTVSMFAGRGKITAWNVWHVYPDVTGAFVRLISGEVEQRDFDLIQRYVVLLYDRASPCSDVNSCRRMLFTVKGKDIEQMPPSEDALMQHLLRAIIQAIFWCNADSPMLPELDFEKWGWVLKNLFYEPRWTTLPEASKACKELIRCGCKKQCSGRCKCKKANLPCTELCYCSGGCAL